jgi:hypothetical protein
LLLDNEILKKLLIIHQGLVGTIGEQSRGYAGEEIGVPLQRARAGEDGGKDLGEMKTLAKIQ